MASLSVLLTVLGRFAFRSPSILIRPNSGQPAPRLFNSLAYTKLWELDNHTVSRCLLWFLHYYV